MPPTDPARASLAGLPALLADLDTDTRNVLLTLARIWSTLATGRISSKDTAADWALTRLPRVAMSSAALGSRTVEAATEEDH